MIGKMVVSSAIGYTIYKIRRISFEKRKLRILKILSKTIGENETYREYIENIITSIKSSKSPEELERYLSDLYTIQDMFDIEER